jgi:hypothetical protein
VVDVLALLPSSPLERGDDIFSRTLEVPRSPGRSGSPRRWSTKYESSTDDEEGSFTEMAPIPDGAHA